MNFKMVFYEVSKDRESLIFDSCSKYLSHFKENLFRGKISEENLLKLKIELNEIIDEDDFVFFVNLTEDDLEVSDLLKKQSNKSVSI